MSGGFSDEEIMKKAAQIAAQIASTSQIEFYQQAEAKISANQKVQHLVEEIKQHQKESVNLQHFQKHEAYRRNEEKIRQLQDELDALPIVQEFRQAQEEANDFLQQMVHLVSRRVTEATGQQPDGSQKR